MSSSSGTEPPASTADRAGVRLPPPLVFALAVIVGVLLDRRVVTLPAGPDELLRPLAWAALICGFLLIGSALVLFHRTGQNPEPWKSTPEVIFTGPYRISRNPMYVGMALLQLAAGLWMANGWVLLLVPLSLYGVYRIAVRPEEIYLERKFGETYREYKASVRRWL